MPNGGSDCCGECVFNPASTVRTGLAASRALTQEAAFCEIRSRVPVDVPFYTYCANFHTRSLVPDGPVFAGFHEHGRLPWHGANPVSLVGERLVVASDGGDREFTDPAAYLAWWRAAHPGDDPEYPWALHESSLPPTMRAKGRDTPSAVERLRALVGRGGGIARRRSPLLADEPAQDAWQRRWDWWRAMAHEERAEWFLARAIDILGLEVEERLADKRFDAPGPFGKTEVWHAWLLRTSEGVADLGAAVDNLSSTAFTGVAFRTVQPRLVPAYRDIWLRPADEPLQTDEEDEVIRDSLAEQLRDLEEGSFRYSVDLPAITADEVAARGFDPRRVITYGFVALEADGTPATAVPSEWAGRVALWQCSPAESVFVESVRVRTRDPALDPEANAKARLALERNVRRLRRQLDAYEAARRPRP